MPTTPAFKKIPLTQGRHALVDTEDFEALRQYKWHARKSSKTWYACRWMRLPEKRGERAQRQYIQMPHQILGKVVRVDHLNCNGLDNRRQNLRIATKSENAQNHVKKKGMGSRFLGVTFHPKTGKWIARIKIDGRSNYLGLFAAEKDAARTYDSAASTHYGPHARTNLRGSG